MKLFIYFSYELRVFARAHIFSWLHHRYFMAIEDPSSKGPYLGLSAPGSKTHTTDLILLHGITAAILPSCTYVPIFSVDHPYKNKVLPSQLVARFQQRCEQQYPSDIWGIMVGRWRSKVPLRNCVFFYRKWISHTHQSGIVCMLQRRGQTAAIGTHIRHLQQATVAAVESRSS